MIKKVSLDEKRTLSVFSQLFFYSVVVVVVVDSSKSRTILLLLNDPLAV